jgi:hypothetical protein
LQGRDALGWLCGIKVWVLGEDGFVGEVHDVVNTVTVICDPSFLVVKKEEIY